eukprot:scaffold124427_cov20-Tisochrysis_lutea.AAC.2
MAEAPPTLMSMDASDEEHLWSFLLDNKHAWQNAVKQKETKATKELKIEDRCKFGQSRKMILDSHQWLGYRPRSPIRLLGSMDHSSSRRTGQGKAAIADLEQSKHRTDVAARWRARGHRGPGALTSCTACHPVPGIQCWRH